MSTIGTSPDWAALYLAHRDAMHRVAAGVLRDAGLADQAGDAVQEAMTALMKSPPSAVRSWEAMMVAVARRKAIDILRSARIRHAGPELDEDHVLAAPEPDFADDAADAIDRHREASVAWDSLSVLDERHRQVVWRRSALEQKREQVAADLGVTPARVSQITAEALEQLREAMARREE